MKKPSAPPEPNSIVRSKRPANDDAIRVEFAGRLKQAMSSRELRPSEVARRAGIGRDSLSLYMNAKTLPTAVSLRKIADALGISAEELMPGTGERGPDRLIAPEFEMTALSNNAELSWLRINKLVSTGCAMQVIQLLIEDERARKEASDLANPLPQAR